MPGQLGGHGLHHMVRPIGGMQRYPVLKLSLTIRHRRLDVRAWPEISLPREIPEGEGKQVP